MLRNHGFANEDDKNFVKIRIRKKIDFYFINLDLELESTESVQPLITELENEVFSGYCGGFDNLGCLEIKPYKIVDGVEVDVYKTFDDAEEDVGGADLFINEFCTIIENLSVESKKIWDQCNRKEFDLGFQGGNTLKTFRTRIQAETIKRCAKLGSSIMFTVYPHMNYDVIQKKDLKKKKLNK